MSNELNVINEVTDEFLKTFGPEKGCALIASIACQLYEKTDQQKIMMVAQPVSGIVTIVTTLDSADQISEILTAAQEKIPSLMERDQADSDEPADPTNNSTDEPPNKKLH